MRKIVTKLHATLRGDIWWPRVECTKKVVVNLTAERTRLNPNRAGSLRYIVSKVLNDGDFQSCTIDDDAVIEVTLTRFSCDREIKTTRWVPISRFASIAHCVKEAL
jgi:hypothetical protein